MIIAWISSWVFEVLSIPTVICSPIVCYLSWEKPLVKPRAPGSLSHIICLCDLFYLPFIFRSIKPKNIKIPCCNLYYLAFDLSIFTTLSRPFAHLWHHYPKGIDNPFYTSGCEYLLFVCRCCLRRVAWFSYWFDNLGLITEGNTYRRCAASSLPLWGNTDVVLAGIRPRGNLGQHCLEACWAHRQRRCSSHIGWWPGALGREDVVDGSLPFASTS